MDDTVQNKKAALNKKKKLKKSKGMQKKLLKRKLSVDPMSVEMTFENKKEAPMST